MFYGRWPKAMPFMPMRSKTNTKVYFAVYDFLLFLNILHNVSRTWVGFNIAIRESRWTAAPS